MIDVLVVNLNCLEHTKNLMLDLNKQIFPDFNLTIVDQNSIEVGTKEYLEKLTHATIIHNPRNLPLNGIWNEFVAKSNKPYIAILNNDIRIPRNFFSDMVAIFSQNKNVGAVLHPTNKKEYSVATVNELVYQILPWGRYRQGWDICMRREAWTPIPDTLKIYCGDDFIFENMYRNGYDAAIATSSPIIHYLGQTRKSAYNTHMPERNPDQDIANYRSMGYVHHMVPPPDYTNVTYHREELERIEEREY